MRSTRLIGRWLLFLAVSNAASAQSAYPIERLLPPDRLARRAEQGTGGTPALENLCDPAPQPFVFPQPMPEQSYFGYSIDFDGRTAIVGDVLHDEPMGLDDTGAAYFFERDGGQWVQRARVVMPEVGLDGNFGWSVAVDGARAMVSCPFARFFRGEVFMFENVAPPGVHADWRLVANIKPDDAESPLVFGYDADLDGTLAAIGALNSNVEPNGWVEIHEYAEGTWRFQTRVRPPDGSIFDDFGRSVAISDGRVIVGAPYHTNTDYRGAAYIFRKGDGGWPLEAKLVPPGLQEDDLAGWVVALDGDTAAVGTPYTALSAPKVWVYRLIEGAWTLEDSIRAPLDNTPPESDFARSMSLDGDSLVVGAPFAEIWGGAYFFRRFEREWSLLGRVRFDEVRTPTVFPGDLGRAVAVAGNTAIVSASYAFVQEERTIVTGLLQPVDLGGPLFAISSHPQSVEAAPGETAVFEGAAIGPDDFAYQWLKNGEPLADDGRITGSTTPMLTITSLTFDDSALFALRVTSPECGTIESSGALLDMGICIDVITTPGPTMLVAGEPLTLVCEAEGILPLAFQWTRGGAELMDDGRITGSNTPILSINPTLPEDQSVYILNISSQCGETPTNSAVVSFLSCVEIEREPGDIYTFIGDNLVLEVAAASHVPLTYRWWKDGSPLLDGGRYGGAFTPRLTITGSTMFDDGVFRCGVSCDFNARSSREAMVVLNPAGCLGDANNDRRVNMVDITSVLEVWGFDYRPATGPGDADRDGLVGFRDLTMVLSRYGVACP